MTAENKNVDEKSSKNVDVAEVASMNIFQKMLRIQSEIPTVAKNLNISAGASGTYKAVSERDVKDAIKPLEDMYGVYSYPVKKELITQDMVEIETKWGKKQNFYIRERVTYRFVNIHKPEEFIEIDGYGDGLDTGDKSPGKSDTYASKYCLMSAYKISTGDDPDADPSPYDEEPQKNETKSPKQEAPKKEPKKKQEAPKQPSPKKNPEVSEATKMAVEMTRLVGELRKIGVDIHDEKVSSFIMDKANVKTVDGGALLNDPPAMLRVIAVLGAILKSKQS